MAGHTLAAFLKAKWQRTCCSSTAEKGDGSSLEGTAPRQPRASPPMQGGVTSPQAKVRYLSQNGSLSLSLLLTRIRGELGPPGTEARPPLRAFEGVKFSLSLFLPSFHWGQVRKRTRAKDPPFPLFWWNRALGSTAGFAAVGRCSWWIASVVLSLSLGHKCSVSDPGLQPHPCCWRDQGREKTNNHEKE